MLTLKDKKRVKYLRDKAVRPVITYDIFHYHFYKYLKEQEARGDFRSLYSEAYAHAMEQMPVRIEEEELIVGKCGIPLSERQQKEWQDLKPFVESQIELGGQDSHMTVDYELLLEKGLSGILETVEEKLAGGHNPFYEACKSCLLAVMQFSDRYAAMANELAQKEVNQERKMELEELAGICSRVPRYPAQNFYEAVQSVHFVTFCLSMDPARCYAFQQFQLGRPDRYLLKYYEKDLASGILTPQRAQLLLDCLGIMINHRVPSGLSSGYMVGGRDKSGVVVANELTELCMNVIEDLRLVFPAVGLCYTQDMPEKYLRRACEILAQGCSHPAIFNDDVIAEGLQLYGVPEEDCREYIQSTCVEITPIASSNVWVASPYINLVRPLLEAMDREYTTVDEIVQMVLEKLDWTIRLSFEEQNAVRRERARRNCNPFLSCLMKDCLERGLDSECGGGRYNWIMPSFVGLANLADSLAVLEQLVFTEKKYTIAELKQMLDCNFEGFEEQRCDLLQNVPKYGNDEDCVDKWCSIITGHIVEECRKYTPALDNGRLVPSVFCWEMHARFGEETGATPDGRPAGFPLGDGSGPAQGREKQGPTASVLSSTKWSHREFIGGVAVNMRFSKRILEVDSYAKIMALIRAFMQRGGFEMQINVVDAETLRAARRNPELYQDLIVRVGGYSDYFVRLSDQMQLEVMMRTEHDS